MKIELKRSRIMMVLALALSFVLTACGGGEDATKEHEAVHDLSYVTGADLEEAIESDDPDIVILDVRQTEDFDKAHVKNALGANLHKANKEDDMEDGKKELEAALANVEETDDTKYYLVCYSGKSYAQAATDVLIDELGISADKIFTVEGGMKEIESNHEDLIE